MNELIQIGPISPLRQRLIDDMTLRGFSTETQRNYLRDVGRFATWLRRSPHTASTEDTRAASRSPFGLARSYFRGDRGQTGEAAAAEDSADAPRSWYRSPA